ncbi:MAG TPA: flavin reductase family protein [Burkholderiales bacterium]|nr:flavin reductase family protein [Steroidobacteraceae bacterium]HYA47145.1 flavin reductase family protein [Burkholderiales bacterium]
MKLSEFVRATRGAKRSLPLSAVYTLLEPGPVVLLTTEYRDRANVMAQSWHTMVDFEPPVVACVVSNRSYSFTLLRATRECVINIPSVREAAKVVGCGNCSGRTVDKFARFGLTALPAARVRPPLIAECHANLECRVVDVSLVRKYNLFILEVVKAWRTPSRTPPRTIHHVGMGAFTVSGRTIRLPSRMK